MHEVSVFIEVALQLHFTYRFRVHAINFDLGFRVNLFDQFHKCFQRCALATAGRPYQNEAHLLEEQVVQLQGLVGSVHVTDEVVFVAGRGDHVPSLGIFGECVVEEYSLHDVVHVLLVIDHDFRV